MPALDVPFLWDLESRMRFLAETEYNRLASNLWYQRITKRFDSESKTEKMNWILSTAQIEDAGPMGGAINFEDMVLLSKEFTNRAANAGLRLHRYQLEDLDGNGIDLAARWSADMGAYAAYWPQKSIAAAIVAGEAATSLAYDGKPFFASDHPLNPKRVGVGTYSNLFTGATARPIDASVTVDVAFTNLGLALSDIRSIKMPNGVDPRFLRGAYILHPPQLSKRVAEITDAKFIAAASTGGGGGTGDVEGVIARWGLGEPIEVPEFAADATSYYIATEEAATSLLGAMGYTDREPFRITYYTGQGGGTGVESFLDRAQQLEWHIQGRNVASYGHPYGLVKIKAA